MFGYMLVKRKTIQELEDKVDDLYIHVFNNAGFVDENGDLNNSVFANVVSETRLKHWNKFHQLSGDIMELFCKLYK